MTESTAPHPTARSLAECEAVIERGMAGFFEAGVALRDIRDHRLYRDAAHATFEDYCRVRWGFTGRHARRLMESAEVVAVIESGPIGPLPPPTNEAQARELAPLVRQSPTRAAEVWREVRDAKGDTVTAADVREAVRGAQRAAPDPVPPTPPRVAPGVEWDREDNMLSARAPEDMSAIVERLLAMGSTFILSSDGRTLWHEPAADLMRSLPNLAADQERRWCKTSLLWSSLGDVPRPLLHGCVARAMDRARALDAMVDELLREEGTS